MGLNGLGILLAVAAVFVTQGCSSGLGVDSGQTITYAEKATDPAKDSAKDSASASASAGANTPSTTLANDDVVCLPDSSAIVGLAGSDLDLRGNAHTQGGVFIATGAKLSLQGHATIDGKLLAMTGATVDAKEKSCVATTPSDADPQFTVTLLRSFMGGLDSTETVADLSAARTFVGRGGVNVINVTDGIHLTGKSQITITGTASDKFIFRVGGNVRLDGHAGFTIAGGALAKNVVVVVHGAASDPSVRLDGHATLVGALLTSAPIEMQGGASVVGAVISGQQLRMAGNSTVIGVGAYCINLK